MSGLETTWLWLREMSKRSSEDAVAERTIFNELIKCHCLSPGAQVSMDLHVPSHDYVISSPWHHRVHHIVSPLKVTSRQSQGVAICCNSESRWLFIGWMNERRIDGATQSGRKNIYATIPYSVAQTPSA